MNEQMLHHKAENHLNKVFVRLLWAWDIITWNCCHVATLLNVIY